MQNVNDYIENYFLILNLQKKITLLNYIDYLYQSYIKKKLLGNFLMTNFRQHFKIIKLTNKHL